MDRNAPLRRAPTNPHTHAYLLVARKDELEVWAVVYCVEDGKNRAAGVSKYMLYPMKPQQLMHDLRACHDVTHRADHAALALEAPSRGFENGVAAGHEHPLD